MNWMKGIALSVYVIGLALSVPVLTTTIVQGLFEGFSAYTVIGMVWDVIVIGLSCSGLQIILREPQDTPTKPPQNPNE